MYKEKSGGFPSAFSRKQRLLVCHVLFDFFDHLLDHIAADVAVFTGGQVAVVALLEVDADLPWCTPSILKSPFAHVFALQKGGKVPCTMKCETGPTLVYREDTIGVMSRSTGLLRQETLEPEDSPARQ